MTTIEKMEKKKRILKNIESMDMNVLEQLDTHVTINGGLSIDELVKTIHFHKLTTESLSYLFERINQNPNTFRGIGPFLFRDGGWYNIRERKLDVIKKLTEENMRLKKENVELKEILESREEFINDHCA
tara:strand:+ start:608 stop:994 length:387 start_codon:yes stop_codon:yes gene_type:complete